MADNGRLNGKIAIVTGGTSGIGRAIVEVFANEGARVVLNGRNAERGREVVGMIAASGGDARFVQADVRLAADCQRTVDEAVNGYGGLDILVNNAGVYFAASASACSEEEWDMTIDVNLKGTFLMSKFALAHMLAKKRGNIINVSSGWGIVGGAGAAAYCASKGGMNQLTRATAIDHGRDGIRVNALCPGDVDTPMLVADAERRGQPWEEYIAGGSDRPLGRIASPLEIAKAALFLASDDSAFMTGSMMVVDGGGTAD